MFQALIQSINIAFTMNTIILMFGFGMAVNLAISFVEEKVFFGRTINSKSE